MVPPLVSNLHILWKLEIQKRKEIVGTGLEENIFASLEALVLI